MRTTSLAKSVRRCRGGRQGRRRPAPLPPPVREERRTEQGKRIDIVVLRGFLKRALEDDDVADPANELLFEHVVAGRYHPSALAESLPTHIGEILGAARRGDWQAVADALIAEARAVDGEV
ncbi:MAG TPA: hypothetical protein VKH20_09260 [Solirubrobacterales bacterium]|nr:hypothetical protein [Solirubrobacterales bacterium]